MGDDGGKIVETRLPAKRRAHLLRVGDDAGRIAGPRRGAVSTLKSTPDTRLTVSITSSTEKPWP